MSHTRIDSPVVGAVGVVEAEQLEPVPGAEAGQNFADWYSIAVAALSVAVVDSTGSSRTAAVVYQS